MHPIPWELFSDVPHGADNHSIIAAGVLRTNSTCTFAATNVSCPSANPTGYITNNNESTDLLDLEGMAAHGEPERERQLRDLQLEHLGH